MGADSVCVSLEEEHTVECANSCTDTIPFDADWSDLESNSRPSGSCSASRPDLRATEVEGTQRSS